MKLYFSYSDLSKLVPCLDLLSSSQLQLASSPGLSVWLLRAALHELDPLLCLLHASSHILSTWMSLSFHAVAMYFSQYFSMYFYKVFPDLTCTASVGFFFFNLTNKYFKDHFPWGGLFPWHSRLTPICWRLSIWMGHSDWFQSGMLQNILNCIT